MTLAEVFGEHSALVASGLLLEVLAAAVAAFGLALDSEVSGRQLPEGSSPSIESISTVLNWKSCSNCRARSCIAGCREECSGC